MNSEFKQHRRLIEDFADALRRVPQCRSVTVDNDVEVGPGYADSIVHALVAGRSLTLVVEAKQNGFPRDVRQAVWQLRRQVEFIPNPGGQVIPIVAAGTLSPGAKALLQEEGVGYFDGDGNLYVPAEGAFVYVEKPPSKPSARLVEAVFSGRRARVVHAVWCKADAWFGVHEIAQEARVSPATASETLVALERREWVISRGAGPAKSRQMVNPAALLDAWAEHQREAPQPKIRHYYVSGPDPDWITFRLHDICERLNAEYEVTGQVAAQSYEPFLTHISKVHCRIAAGQQDEVLSGLNARPVREGWNLGVIEMTKSDTLAFRQRDEHRWLADPLQTYLDLLQEGGRSEEMANHLRAERLGV